MLDRPERQEQGDEDGSRQLHGDYLLKANDKKQRQVPLDQFDGRERCLSISSFIGEGLLIDSPVNLPSTSLELQRLGMCVLLLRFHRQPHCDAIQRRPLFYAQVSKKAEKSSPV